MTKDEFVFPMNYKNKEKFLGVIEYKIVIAILILSGIIFYILKNIAFELSTKVAIFIIIIGFFSVLLIIGFNGENMLDFLKYVIKFFYKERVYVYRKSEEEEKFCTKVLKVIFQ